MKLTTALKNQIQDAVKRKVFAKVDHLEIGLRETPLNKREWVANELCQTPAADLGDLCRLTDLKELEDNPLYPGMAIIDCYVYSKDQLETNVTVFIKDGLVVAAFEVGEYRQEEIFRVEWLRTLGRGENSDKIPA